MPARKLALVLAAAALLQPIAGTIVPNSCRDTGYVCSSQTDGETDYCERWASNSVCVAGKCMSPASCYSSSAAGACVKGSAGNTCRHACDNDCDEPRFCQAGTDSHDCGTQKKEPEKKKSCTKGSPGDTCLFSCDGDCDEPRLCKKGTDTTDCGGPPPSVSSSSSSSSSSGGMFSQMAELVATLLQTDTDDEIPTRFHELVTEVDRDKNTASATSTEDFANIMGALGYDKPRFTGSNFVSTIDHDLVQGNKLTCNGALNDDSASIRACFNSFDKLSEVKMLSTISEWNVNKRLSTAFVNSETGAPCVQSDLLLTSYEKANVQLTQRFLSTFAVSAKVFHITLMTDFHKEL